MLYNKYELQWMIKAVDQLREQNEAIISEMTTLPEEFRGCDIDEKMEALNNIEFASNLANKLVEDMNEVTKVENDFISVDADLQGELLVLCSELHTAWDTDPHKYFDGQKHRDIGYQYYLLGNIEGRLKSGRVMADDMSMLEAWQEELENE